MIITMTLRLLKYFLLLMVIVISFCLPLETTCQEEDKPFELNTKKEDISLTDDIKTARAQVAKYPDNPEAHFNLAIALSRTSLIEETISELRRTKILIRKPKNANIINKKIKEYEHILENEPGANNIKYRLAFSYYLQAYYIAKEKEKQNQTGNKDKKLFDTSLFSVKNTDPMLDNYLNKSVYYFNDLIKSDPDDIWAKVYYGFILAEQFNKYDEAEKLWLEALKQDPNNPAPHFFIGELNIKEGDLKTGLKEISQAILLRSLGY